MSLSSAVKTPTPPAPVRWARWERDVRLRRPAAPRQVLVRTVRPPDGERRHKSSRQRAAGSISVIESAKPGENTCLGRAASDDPALCRRAADGRQQASIPGAAGPTSGVQAAVSR